MKKIEQTSDWPKIHRDDEIKVLLTRNQVFHVLSQLINTLSHSYNAYQKSNIEMNRQYTISKYHLAIAVFGL